MCGQWIQNMTQEEHCFSHLEQGTKDVDVQKGSFTCFQQTKDVLRCSLSAHNNHRGSDSIIWDLLNRDVLTETNSVFGFVSSVKLFFATGENCTGRMQNASHPVGTTRASRNTKIKSRRVLT